MDTYVNSKKVKSGIGGKSVQDQVDDLAKVIANAGGGGMTSVTYAELVSLRGNSQLKPGTFYRITDYVTTTVQDDTRSAGHAFDLIVLASDSKTLSEEARAIVHEGDTYFTEAGANLAAWKVWYCLDNDTARFAWADAENGKGVIYRMIDGHGNDCPYDFKNIQFIREINAGGGGYVEVDGDYAVFCYTFSWEDSEAEILDASIVCNNGQITNDEGNVAGVYKNVIKPDIMGVPEYSSQFLNNIVFLSTYGYEDRFFYGCSNNSFGNGCSNNSFGNGCQFNSFGNHCSNNSFGNHCENNSFGDNCSHNSFGDNCYSNSFGNRCQFNSFGEYCSRNSFGDNFYKNSFGFSHQFNNFGNGCSNNSFGNSCTANSFGNHCENNSFGNHCENNSFGNNCTKISFGNGIDEPISYVKNISFGDGCTNVSIINGETASSSQQIQNIRVANGTSGSVEVDRNLLARDWVVGVDIGGEDGALMIKALL